MADKKVTNVYTKLAQARLKFLQAGASKSGKNMHLEFKYFELEDIVPAATQIFAELNLIHVVSFEDGLAKMTVMDAEDPVDEITFTLPFREIDPIVSKTGNVVTNPLQALGASITYLRRYLWMMCLDIVEADSIDSNLGNEKPAEKVEAKPAEAKEEPKPEKKKAKPKTAAERKEIAKELTSPEGPADELQIAALKKACADLVKLNPEDEKLTNFVKTLGEKTKLFTEISKSDATKVIENIGVMIKSYYKDGKDEQ